LTAVESGEEGRVDTSGSEEKNPVPLWSIHMKAEMIDYYMDKVHTSVSIEAGPWQLVTKGRTRSSLPQDCQAEQFSN
jgi:hypothetical protein